jgi:hypothetical protein
MSGHQKFEAWAKVHLGQGYGLEMEEGVYIHPVTRWAFKGFLAGRQQLTEEACQAAGAALAVCGTHLYPSDHLAVLTAIRSLSGAGEAA